MLLQYPFVINALMVCLVLAGTYTYFGYHVVRRGVIFVDLALAQVAALGASVGVLLGWGMDHFPVQNYLVSLGFTMAGALLFVLFRSRRENVPIEALIGITYAASIALSLIVLERSASGTEDIKGMLAGALLTVPLTTVLLVAGLCAAVAVIHWFSREQIIAITENHAAAREKGVHTGWWDFVFYVTFGIVVTSSVKVAGVLLVFAFLIMPAVAAMLAAEGMVRRILFGWGFGLAGCVAGIEASLRLDWTPAPTIVIVFLLLLVGTWAWTAGREYLARPRT